MADNLGSFIGLASTTILSSLRCLLYFSACFLPSPALSESTIYDFYASFSFCPILSFYCPLILVCPFSLIPC